MFKLVRRLAGRPIQRRARRLAADFLRQTERAGDVQRELLMSRIARHADGRFGRDHHFGEIRNPADFRRMVPVRGYDGHEPYIDRVRKGDTRALFGTGTEVLMFAMTSGTTDRPKTIPVTSESLADYREGWTIWGMMAFDAHPGILQGGLRPILQLASNWREHFTPSGIPCGAITGLTAQMQNPIVRFTYCMPPAASRIEDIESKYYVALRLSAHRDLGTIIAANWTGGTMGAYLRGYPEYFGDRPVRDIGLIASEGRMTIPIEDGTPGGILDIRHHYFEFMPEDQVGRDEPETVEATDLIEGRRYFILPTTAGGLYRYQIHDPVRCVGFHGRAPVIEFLNKGAHFSSMTGEKLSEFQVVAAVTAAQRTLGIRLGSFLLLPTWGEPPFYTLLVEKADLGENLSPGRLADEVDAQLRRQN